MEDNKISTDLLTQEYVSLKTEIRDIVKECNTLGKFSILFTAAFLAYVLKEKNFIYPVPFRFLPAAFTLLLGFRVLTLGWHIGTISKYTCTIESAFFRKEYLKALSTKTEEEIKKQFGWERYYDSTRTISFGMKSLGFSIFLFWIVNLLISIFIGWWLLS